MAGCMLGLDWVANLDLVCNSKQLLVKVEGTSMCLELIDEPCQCNRRVIFGIAVLSLLVNLTRINGMVLSHKVATDEHPV